jgi:hypothetical protein
MVVGSPEGIQHLPLLLKVSRKERIENWEPAQVSTPPVWTQFGWKLYSRLL